MMDMNVNYMLQHRILLKTFRSYLKSEKESLRLMKIRHNCDGEDIIDVIKE